MVQKFDHLFGLVKYDNVQLSLDKFKTTNHVKASCILSAVPGACAQSKNKSHLRPALSFGSRFRLWPSLDNYWSQYD